jgi:ribosomal protein S27AE
MNHIEELLKSLFVMASLVEARDPYTGGHLWRVAQFSQLLAIRAGLPPRDVARIALGGFLHDLGKIGVPDAILNKPDRLTDAEFEVIKTHPSVGNRLLSGHPLAELARDAVLCHHERPDGQGYPDGLSGDEISVDAKIIGISDAFDAMTSTRPYRRGMACEAAFSIIEKCLGTQFDMELGKLFLIMGRAGELDHVVGHSDLGIPIQECPECGPTIVVRRDQESGDFVYCRKCGYKTTVIRENGAISIAETDDHGNAEELEPEVDVALIDELVSEAASVIG